jgi:hypothetical protein
VDVGCDPRLAGRVSARDSRSALGRARRRPAGGGRVRLRSGGNHVAEAAADADGAFLIELTCDRPLPPGDYQFVAEAPGFETRMLATTFQPTVPPLP